MNNRGFTIIEMSLVLAVTVTLFAATSWLYGRISADKNAMAAATQVLVTTRKLSRHFESHANTAALADPAYAESNKLYAAGMRKWSGGTWAHGGSGPWVWRAEEWLTPQGWRMRIDRAISANRPAGYGPDDGFQIALLDVPRPAECLTIINAVNSAFDTLLVDDDIYKTINTPYDRDGAVAACTGSTDRVKIQGFRF